MLNFWEWLRVIIQANSGHRIMIFGLCFCDKVLWMDRFWAVNKWLMTGNDHTCITWYYDPDCQFCMLRFLCWSYVLHHVPVYLPPPRRLYFCLCRFVCQQDNWNSCRQILMNFLGVGCVTRNKWLDFRWRSRSTQTQEFFQRNLCCCRMETVVQIMLITRVNFFQGRKSSHCHQTIPFRCCSGLESEKF